MKKFITAILATTITATSAFAIDLSKYEYAPKPSPAPVVEIEMPHIPWTDDSHRWFFDMIMTQVVSDEDLDPRYTTPMLVDAVKCMDEHFSNEYGFAEFITNFEFPSDEFNIEVELATELCFTASFVIHSSQEEIKYY